MDRECLSLKRLHCTSSDNGAQNEGDHLCDAWMTGQRKRLGLAFLSGADLSISMLQTCHARTLLNVTTLWECIKLNDTHISRHISLTA